MEAEAFLPWVQVLRAVTDLPNSTRHSVFHLSGTWAVPCPLLEVKPLLVGLGSLGTALGTRPRRCTPISVSLVVVQTRPDIRIRVRRIVIRIRVRHTAIRIRVVVAAIDHTAYGSFHPEKCILSAFRLQRYSFSARLPKIPPTSTGLRPYFLMSSYLRHHALTLYSLYALSLRSRFRFSAYATSTAALYAATLSATTILPRKARRDPTYECELDESLPAFAYDTPPPAYALLVPR